MTSCRLSNAEIRQFFDVFDEDRSGEISAVELSNALRALGFTNCNSVHSQHLIHEHFGTETNAIDFEKFKALVDHVQLPSDSPVEAFHAFTLFDRSRIGKISPADLKVAGMTATGRNVPDSIVRSIMEACDTDKDGYLSLDEFRKAVSKGGKGTEGGPLDISKLEVKGVETDAATSKAIDESNAALAAEVNLDVERLKALSQKASESHKIGVVLRTFGGVRVPVIGGKIQRPDVRKALGEFGYDSANLSDEDFDAIFNDADGDNDDHLTVKEYCTLLDGLGEDSREK